MKIIKFLSTLVLGAMVVSCSGLSDQAKEIVGKYYIPEISQEVPLLELNGNGKCVIRAIKPGLLTYEVPGRWNVVDDSLIVELKPEKMTYEGDSTMIGNISERWTRRVADHNEYTLTLTVDGQPYVYFLRNEAED